VLDDVVNVADIAIVPGKADAENASAQPDCTALLCAFEVGQSSGRF